MAHVMTEIVINNTWSSPTEGDRLSTHYSLFWSPFCTQNCVI